MPVHAYLHSRLMEESEARVEMAAHFDSPDRKSTRLNSSHLVISYAVFCLKKKKKHTHLHLYTPHHNHTPDHYPLRALPTPPTDPPDEAAPTRPTTTLHATIRLPHSYRADT